MKMDVQLIYITTVLLRSWCVWLFAVAKAGAYKQLLITREHTFQNHYPQRRFRRSESEALTLNNQFWDYNRQTWAIWPNGPERVEFEPPPNPYAALPPPPINNNGGNRGWTGGPWASSIPVPLPPHITHPAFVNQFQQQYGGKLFVPDLEAAQPQRGRNPHVIAGTMVVQQNELRPVPRRLVREKLHEIDRLDSLKDVAIQTIGDACGSHTSCPEGAVCHQAVPSLVMRYCVCIAGKSKKDGQGEWCPEGVQRELEERVALSKDKLKLMVGSGDGEDPEDFVSYEERNRGKLASEERVALAMRHNPAKVRERIFQVFSNYDTPAEMERPPPRGGGGPRIYQGKLPSLEKPPLPNVDISSWRDIIFQKTDNSGSQLVTQYERERQDAKGELEQSLAEADEASVFAKALLLKLVDAAAASHRLPAPPVWLHMPK